MQDIDYSAQDSGYQGELITLRKRISDLEAENQNLYQQLFQLRERLAGLKIEEKERAEFISNVAHELRSPLTSIKGYVDLMLDGETGPINELQHEFLGVVEANSDRLARTISELLDVSRLESGRLSFRPSPVDLKPLLNASIDEIKPQLNARQISLEFDYPPIPARRRGLEINADGERLSQAFRVLLSNAGRYTKTGGKIRLAVGLNPDKTQVTISIEDEGPYIAPDEISKVFSKFWQPENPAWREYGNPGLGLAVVKSIAEMHEAEVAVQSREGVGNIFSIKLAVFPESALLLATETEVQKQKAVLVVAPDSEDGKLAEELLGQSGFNVIVLNDPADAVTPAPSLNPDLVLSINIAKAQKDELVRTSSWPGMPFLHLTLSPRERAVILNGAQAVLPWPSPKNMLEEYAALIIGADQPPTELEKLKQSKGILVVSSSTANLRQIDKILQDGDYKKVYRATGISDTLTLARRHRPALFIVDLSEENERQPGLFDELNEDGLITGTNSIVLLPAASIAVPDEQASSVSQNQAEYVNLVHKPFLRRRFINLAHLLSGGAN